MISGSINLTAGQYVTIPYNSILDNFTAFTISCWINQPAAGGGGTFIQKGWASNGSILMYNNGTNGYSLDIVSDTGTSYGTGAGFTPNDTAWHHVVFVYDGSNIFCYIDSIVSASVPTPTQVGPLTLNSTFTIGGGFVGNVADVRVYNVVLAQTEVNSLYHGHNIDRGLVADFAFPEGSGTTTTDSINNLVGTLTGGATWSRSLPTIFTQTHYSYRYVYSPQAYQSSNINAISDTFKINNDQSFAGGPNDEQYYTFGMFIGPTVSSLTGAIPVNLNLTISYSSGTPSINFTASYNGVIQNTFTIPIIIGDIYQREIVYITNTTSGEGDNTTPNPSIRYNVLAPLRHYRNVFTFTYTPSNLPNNSRFIQVFSGAEWWTFSTFPFNLEYNVNVTDFGYSFDGGNTYYQIQGSDLNIKTDGKYPIGSYPIQNYNLIVPGPLPAAITVRGVGR